MTILLTTAAAALLDEPSPPCPGCGSALSRIDVGRDALWLCDGCDTVMPHS